MNKLRKQRKKMRQQCDIELTRTAAGAWCDETQEPSPAEAQIDVERTVWDPEYRNQVREQLRVAD